MYFQPRKGETMTDRKFIRFRAGREGHLVKIVAVDTIVSLSRWPSEEIYVMTTAIDEQDGGSLDYLVYGKDADALWEAFAHGQFGEVVDFVIEEDV
jgi:hypothetical protein